MRDRKVLLLSFDNCSHNKIGRANSIAPSLKKNNQVANPHPPYTTRREKKREAREGLSSNSY